MKKKEALTIGVAIITHNAKKHLPHCLPPLINNTLKPKIVVVNSSSSDGTVEMAEEMGVSTLVIPRSTFNHGATREKARLFLNTDIIVMVTPDAYAFDVNTLTHLVTPLIEKKASIAYARQIPHDRASFFEAFPRHYNYPETSHYRSLDDLDTYGVYTFFCSNSFAAYTNKALEEIGGFSPVLLGEDTLATSKLLKRGHTIAYVAEAIVKHSHGYTLSQEFRRNFDTGLARKKHAAYFKAPSTDQKRGWNYFLTMARLLTPKKPHLLPFAFVQSLTKFLGYTLGRVSLRAPKWWLRTLSSQDFFWSSDYAESFFQKTNNLTDNTS